MNRLKKGQGTKPTRFVLRTGHLAGDPRPAAPGAERRVFCKHYGGCLDHALTAEWPGFTCSECSTLALEVRDSQEVTAEADRCVDLLAAAYGPGEDVGSRGNVGWAYRSDATRRKKNAKIEESKVDMA